MSVSCFEPSTGFPHNGLSDPSGYCTTVTILTLSHTKFHSTHSPSAIEASCYSSNRKTLIMRSLHWSLPPLQCFSPIQQHSLVYFLQIVVQVPFSQLGLSWSPGLNIQTPFYLPSTLYNPALLFYHKFVIIWLTI